MKRPLKIGDRVKLSAATRKQYRVTDDKPAIVVELDDITVKLHRLVAGHNYWNIAALVRA